MPEKLYSAAYARAVSQQLNMTGSFMKVKSSHSKYLTIIVLVTSFVLAGCFQSVLLTQGMLEHSNEDDIVVTLRDGQSVRFSGQQYKVDADENGRHVLRGKGKQYNLQGSRFAVFDGTIPLENIERITTMEKTSLFYVVVIGSVGAVGAMLLFVLALQGRGFGG